MIQSLRTPRSDRASTRSESSSHPTSPLGLVLIDLSRGLDDAGVPHAFQRGHRDLPSIRPGGDVDMALSEKDLAAFAEQLEEACRRHGARIRARHRIGGLVQHHLHARTSDGRHHLVDLDVHVRETCYGVPFLEASELCGGPRGEHDLPETAPYAGVWIDLLGAHLVGGKVSADYRTALHDRRDEVGARSVGARLLGRKRSARLLGQLEDPDALRAHSAGDRRSLLLRRFRCAPLASLYGLARLVWATRVRTLFRPRGLCVAFLGTDGSGKTTILERVRERLGPAFRSDASGVIKLRPGLLPQLDRLVHMGRATQGMEDWSRPHRAPASGRVLSNLRALYYGLDYTLGYFLRILPRRRRNSLLLFDRWFDDYKVDPRRFRVQPDCLAVRVLDRIVPKPDAVIVITADPMLVQERKQELEATESARQVRAYEALASASGRYHVIRNEGTVDETVDAVLEVLLGGAA